VAPETPLVVVATVYDLSLGELSERNIIASYVPIHMQEAAQFLGYRKGDLPVTEKVAGEVLSLPMYAELTDAQIDRVAASVNEFMRKA
jgi:dTDP-4-amino-4,6-dideoxygalactose transaminase